MTRRNRFRFRRFLTVAAMIFALAFSLSFAACDQLNRPMGSPSSSSTSGGPTSTTSSDGGGEGGSNTAPAPSITAQPGDIQI